VTLAAMSGLSIPPLVAAVVVAAAVVAGTAS